MLKGCVMKRITSRLVCSLIGISLLMPSAHAEMPLALGTIRIYSSICVHPESADLLGIRIVILRFPAQDYVLFQMAEGELEQPQLYTAYFDPQSSGIEFQVRFGSSTHVNRINEESANSGGVQIATYRGAVTDETLTGQFDYGSLDQPIGRALPQLTDRPLMRVDALEAEFPVCTQ